MHLSVPFINRPIGTTLLTVAVALMGAVAFRSLPVAPLPQVEYPTIHVMAGLPGASPETMATAVAAPLERQFGRVAGIAEMTSTNYLGLTSIVLQFELSRDINGAARDVQAAINAAQAALPPVLPRSPVYRRVNPADAPILVLALTSDTMRRGRLYDAASTILQQKLSQVEGVGQVLVGGGSLPAVRVELNPAALNRYGIGLEDVRRVLARTNVNRPTGQLMDGARTWEIRTTDQLRRAEEYGPLIIAYRAGRAVRLSDVARVEDSVEDLRTAGLTNGQEAVLVILYREPGANIIETVDRVRGLLPQLTAALPGSITLSVVLDRTPTIRASLRDVERTLVIAVLLVILVVFAFLRDVRAAAIPSVAVPVSLLGTFGVMYLCGYSLDNLSLMALTIATLFVVDDTVVVLENVSRYRERGVPSGEAALRGTREITFTVLSMSLSLVAVFIPILFMGGMVGRLFREFAVTLSMAVLLSLVVSLTTTPMMCAVLLKPRPASSRGPLDRAGERAYVWMLSRYMTGLLWALRHPRGMLALTLAAMALSVYLFAAVPKGFFPEQDTGRLGGVIQAAEHISFQAMREKLTEAVDLLRSDPAVETVIGYSGGGGGTTTNVGRLFIGLKPVEERRLALDQVMARLRDRLATVPGVSPYLRAGQDLSIGIGGRRSHAQYQYTLRGADLTELTEWAPRVTEQFLRLPELVDVGSDQQNRGLQSVVVIDRDTASRLGITPQLIDDTLYDAFGQRQVSILYTSLNQYHVVMEVAPEYWQRPSTLDEVYVRSSMGTQVPLSVVAHYELSPSTLAVSHDGQFPSVTLSFNLAPGVSLGQAVAAIETAVRRLDLPAGIRGSLRGTAQAFQASLADQPLLILAALVTVYIVLGILYGSYVHPLTILSTLPSAGVGALLALLLCRMELSVIAFIGIILLIGVVKRNAIMMIDFAVEAERAEAKRPVEAIYAACVLRFRPIMMTTMAALLGALPLALGTGVGSELRRPLGIAIIGGLFVSQMLTLFTTPVVYLALDGLRFGRPPRAWRARRPEP